MEYRALGRHALKVSPLCLGTMLFGQETDEATAECIVASAREHGINFLDTADVYLHGRSEEVVGRLIASHRDEWVLATKMTVQMGPGPNQRGYSRKWVIEAVEESLRRLGTDYVDVVYLHTIAYGQPLDEPIRAFADLIRQGKMRYFGISNFHGWRIAEVCRIADELSIDRPLALQPLYNIVNRNAEVEQLPAANHFGIGVVGYSPLARGVLTAKYQPDTPPPADTRAGRNEKRILETEWRPESLAIAQKLSTYAEAKGISASQFAIAWVLNNRLVTSTIAGPRTMEQWDSYLAALDYTFSAEDEALVDQLVAPGYASTLGYTDPAHPVEGRLPRTGTVL
jgi:aryl-alcohol dehydrogenase-like predicted oxidoreductase